MSDIMAELIRNPHQDSDILIVERHDDIVEITIIQLGQQRYFTK